MLAQEQKPGLRPRISGPRVPLHSPVSWLRHELWSEISCVTLDKFVTLSGLQYPLLLHGITAPASSRVLGRVRSANVCKALPAGNRVSAAACKGSSRNPGSFHLRVPPEMRSMSGFSKTSRREQARREGKPSRGVLGGAVPAQPDPRKALERSVAHPQNSSCLQARGGTFTLPVVT